MKKIISLVLVFCLTMLFFACGNGMSPAEEALIAVKQADIDGFYTYMTADSATSLTRILNLSKSLDDEGRASMKSLYALLQYTMGEETKHADGTKTVSVTVKIPDMARIRTLAEKKILVSAETANAVIDEMLKSGEIAKAYMLEEIWEIDMREEDGAWKIAYADHDNAAFVNGLYLAEMLTFFAQN